MQLVLRMIMLCAGIVSPLARLVHAQRMVDLQPDRRWTQIGGHVLGRPTTVSVGRSDVAVVDAADTRILVLDLDGRLKHALGRRGEGPGEFRRIDALQRHHDTLIVHDGGLRRITIFAPTGRLVRLTQMPTLRDPLAALAPLPLGVTSSGNYVAIPDRRIKDRSNLNAANRTAVALYSPDGTFLRDLTGVEILRRFIEIREPEASVLVPQPLSDDPVIAARDLDGDVLVIDRRVADRDAPVDSITIRRVSEGGIVRWSRRVAYAPIPVAKGDRAALVEDVSRVLRMYKIKTLAAAVTFTPQMYPAVGGLIIGADGRLWIRWTQPGTDHQSWTILDGSGRFVGRVDAPAPHPRLRLLGANETHVWGLSVTGAGEPLVVRLAWKFRS